MYIFEQAERRCAGLTAAKLRSAVSSFSSSQRVFQPLGLAPCCKPGPQYQRGVDLVKVTTTRDYIPCDCARRAGVNHGHRPQGFRNAQRHLRSAATSGPDDVIVSDPRCRGAVADKIRLSAHYGSSLLKALIVGELGRLVRRARRPLLSGSRI